VSDPFVGEVRLVGFNFAPINWMLCQGQIVSISENSTLYNLIGTTYGGDGTQSFALPNLIGRIPVHQGSSTSGNYPIGMIGGTTSVTLTAGQLPAHTHALMAANVSTGTGTNPANAMVAAGVKMYSAAAPDTAMNPAMVTIAQGGNLPHDNMQPYLVLNWIISMYGIYPSQG
jgi:microcystin-dependent protein